MCAAPDCVNNSSTSLSCIGGCGLADGNPVVGDGLDMYDDRFLLSRPTMLGGVYGVADGGHSVVGDYACNHDGSVPTNDYVSHAAPCPGLVPYTCL